MVVAAAVGATSVGVAVPIAWKAVVIFSIFVFGVVGLDFLSLVVVWLSVSAIGFTFVVGVVFGVDVVVFVFPLGFYVLVSSSVFGFDVAVFAFVAGLYVFGLYVCVSSTFITGGVCAVGALLVVSFGGGVSCGVVVSLHVLASASVSIAGVFSRRGVFSCCCCVIAVVSSSASSNGMTSSVLLSLISCSPLTYLNDSR